MPQILMPALSPTMEEGTLAKWLVAEGAQVTSGDVIAEIETDKATMEIEAIDEGVLTQILVAAGTENVKVNTPIAFIQGEDEAAAPPRTNGASKIADAAKLNVSDPRTATDTAVIARSPGASATVARAPSPMPEAERPEAVSADAQETATPVVPEVPPGTAMRQQTMREALRDAMAEEMRRDGDVFLMGEEVGQYQGAYKISQGLLEEFGEQRIIDTPITEYGFAGLGVGAAMAGLKPIVEFMTFNFAMQAIDHIVNSAAKTLYMSGGQMRCPIVFRGPNGAASRVAAQHSQCFSAWYASVPGLKVIAPSNAADAKGLLKAAIRDPNPIVFLEHELLYGTPGDVPEGDIVLPIGKARVVRPGRDVTLVSFARGVIFSLDAAKALAAEGIEAEVIDLRTLRPLDMATVIASVKRTSRLVTVEEAWPVCSVGAEVCATVTEAAFDWLDAPPTRVSGADVPMPYAANLEKLALPNAEIVAAAVRTLLGR